MAKQSDIEPLIVQEWLKRPVEKRSEGDVLTFHGQLYEQRPDLLSFNTPGDKYQVLMAILRNHIAR